MVWQGRRAPLRSRQIRYDRRHRTFASQGSMLRHCVTVLLLVAVVGTASIALATDGARRPQASAQVDLPQGDPLADPLALSAAERSLFADASDGRFDEHSLIDAALVACGDDNPAAVSRYRRQFAAVCDELRQANIPTADIAGQIELIHRLLHQRLLHGGYDANATDLAGTFDTGIYNCASATLLFRGASRTSESKRPCN